jgi:proline iminopeptidase
MLHAGPGADYRSLTRLRNAVDGVRLEDGHRLVFWDQRGTGLSKRHDPDELTDRNYDADLDAIVDRFSPNRPVVFISHSWGAMYATRYITQHPEKVAGAVLMEPGPLTGELYSEIASEFQKLDFFSEWLNDYTWAERFVSPDDHARADYLLALGRFGDSEPGFHKSTTDCQPFWRLGAVAAARRHERRRRRQTGMGLHRRSRALSNKVLFEASELNEVIARSFSRR